MTPITQRTFVDLSAIAVPNSWRIYSPCGVKAHCWQAGKDRIPLGWRDHLVLCFSLSSRVWAGWSMVRRPLCLVGVDALGRAVLSGGPYSPHDALVDTVFRWVLCTRLPQQHCGRYQWPRLVSSALAFLAPRSSTDGLLFRRDGPLADEVW